MIEFFDTISSYVDKFLAYMDTLFDSLQQGITELKTWISFLPTELLAGAGIIVVLLVVFRILGR